MNLRQLLYGIVSFLPFAPEALYRGTGNTSSGLYCYTVWLRHIAFAGEAGYPVRPARMAELGPGDSIGVGIAAVATGVDEYVAFDVTRHASQKDNLRIFREVAGLVRARSPMAGPETFPEMGLFPTHLEFPHATITPEMVATALGATRIQEIEAELASHGPWTRFIYDSDWDSVRASVEPVDFLLSQAVMEHVSDLSSVYKAMFHALKPGAAASHEIDFRSHGLFSTWDGHWRCPAWLWKLFLGRRKYLLNREPLSRHLASAIAAGFQIRHLIRHTSQPSTKPLSKEFRNLSKEDRETSGAYLLLVKPG